MAENDGTPIEAVEIHTPTSTALATSDPESILRYAIDKGANVDVIERVMAVRRELQAEFAKKSYDEAMAAFQAECPIVQKLQDVKGKTGNRIYKFAPMDDILTQKDKNGVEIRQLIQRHGFSHSLTSESDTQFGWVQSNLKITHKGGHSEVSSFRVPIEKTDYISLAQAYAVALSFSTRYAFRNGYGIFTTDEDIDGKIAKEKAAPPSKLSTRDEKLMPYANALWVVVKKEGEKNWDRANKWMRDNNILNNDEAAPDLSRERFEQVTTAAKKLLEQLGGQQ